MLIPMALWATTGSDIYDALFKTFEGKSIQLVEAEQETKSFDWPSGFGFTEAQALQVLQDYKALRDSNAVKDGVAGIKTAATAIAKKRQYDLSDTSRVLADVLTTVKPHHGDVYAYFHGTKPVAQRRKEAVSNVVKSNVSGFKDLLAPSPKMLLGLALIAGIIILVKKK